MRRLFTALFCLIGVSVSGQEYSDTTKTLNDNNLSIELPSLFFNELNLGYERAINQNLRLKLSFPFLRRDVSKMVLTNLTLNSIYSENNEVDVEDALDELEGLGIIKMNGISIQLLYVINPSNSGFFLSPQYTYRKIDSELELDQSDLSSLSNTGLISSSDNYYEVDLEFELSFLGFCIGHRWEKQGWCFDSLIGIGKYVGDYELQDTEGEVDLEDDFDIILPKVGLTFGYSF